MFRNILTAAICLVASTNVKSQTVYLPAGAEYIRHTPSAAPNSIIDAKEQRGVIVYKGKSCFDESDAFILSEDGAKKFGNNEWVDVHLQMQIYKPAAKMVFDQVMQLNPPAVELNKKRDAFKAEKNSDGTPMYNLKIVDVADGKMLILNQHITCAESKYKSYEITSFYSYAVIGTSIIWIDASYNAATPDLAIKTHNDVVGQIKKVGSN